MGTAIQHMVETTEKRDNEEWIFLDIGETNLTWVSIVVVFEKQNKTKTSNVDVDADMFRQKP